MSAARLTIQKYGDGGWRDAATLEVLRPDDGAAGPCMLLYDIDYAVDCYSAPGNPLRQQIACAAPVELVPRTFSRWPAFVDDIRPGGAAERWWTARLGLRHAPERARDFPLLARGTIAPVGDLRIREALPPRAPDERRFPVSAVVDRDYSFLEYAVEQGAAVGGATGAGGDAPKMLLRVADDGEVWIDTWQDRPRCQDAHYLVKFARNQRTERDRLVLRTEYVYYQALHALGMSSIDVSGMRLVEGAHEPSLWLPRFDVARDSTGAEVRFGLESLYALIDAPPGSWQKHQTYLARLHEVLAGEPDYDPAALTLEYLRRDLLNLAFGNSDNHGRNTAILKTPQGARLAPIYDFAPMKLDPEGVVRSTRWAQYERGGRVDWRGLVHSLETHAPADVLWDGLCALADALADLGQLLRRLGAAPEVLEAQALGLRRTPEWLRESGLI